MTKISYSDVTKALADLAENRVQVMVAGIALVKSQVETGKVKILAITNLKRAAAVPDLLDRNRGGHPVLALDGLIGIVRPQEPAAGHGGADRGRRAGGRRRPCDRPAAGRHRPAARSRRHRGVRGGRGRAAQEHRRHRQGPGDPADAIGGGETLLFVSRASPRARAKRGPRVNSARPGTQGDARGQCRVVLDPGSRSRANARSLGRGTPGRGATSVLRCRMQGTG